jgi:NAD(P)-dependent dehydrogenase (short-subunit alcohol dehydrogenase family)
MAVVRGSQGPFDLTGRVCLVTGGNAGIGLGIAKTMASLGADIAVVGRRPERNEAAAAEISEAGTKVVTFAADVADESAVEEAVQRTIDTFGRIDSCVASAGIASQRNALPDFPVDEWNRVIGVNLSGAFHVMRAVSRVLVRQGEGGSLIAVGSVSALHGHPKAAPYGAAKAGLVGLVRSAAVELGPYGIRTNLILPGWIDTELIADITRSQRMSEAVLARVPLGRWGGPEDLGGLAAYLASDAGRYHTGDVIRVDGGYAIC